jgi:ABC-type glycerol-3-phosphate transport system substrate-binding protein
LPRSNDAPRTIARVYAFAILTNDESRRSQALALLDHLFDPELHSELTLAMHWLPTRPVVLENWPNTLTFKGVVRSQLEGAVALPSDRSFADFARQLQQMLTRVLNGEITPEKAATEFR